MIETIIGVVIALVVGAVVGFIISRAVLSNAAKNAKNNAETLVSDAKRQADTIKKEAQLEAKDVAYQAKQEAEREANEQRKELRGIENRLNQREDNLDKRAGSLDTREHQLSSLQGQVEKDRRDLEDAQKETQKRLEQVARMNTDEAKAALLDSVRGDVVHEEAAIIREAEQRAQSEAAKKSREILTTTIQRVAADHTAERTVTSVSIPSEDVKGRIIGREGRNIRTFEQITGVNLIVDDTPDTVVISGFDPVRREIGRVTLENLIADGRIHPARIEEMYNKANDLVWQQVQDAGEEAAFDTGIHDLHPELVKT
ncbi:MAG: Rnase Y domain-containing protein, partial [Coriobacteriales bacterium]|nr:Rnase Y domain-containing protein [Coriobacteriales bacterium]